MKQRSRNVGLSGATIGSSDEDRVMSSRRRLLRHAAGSIPVIMTLNSGAALAVASSLLAEESLSDNADSIDPARTVNGDLVCLKDPYGIPVQGTEKVAPPLNGCLVPSQDYGLETDDVVYSDVDVCVGDGSFLGADDNETYSGQNGMLVSITALTSVAPTPGFTDCL